VSEDVERYAPDAGSPARRISLEHLVRYRFAAGFACGAATLDLGCGEGYGTAMLARAGAQWCVGVDVSHDSVRRAHARYGSDSVSYAVSDAVGLPFADDAFDLVVCFEVVEHLLRPQRLLAECRRILKPEGTLVISTPNRLLTGARSKFHVTEYSSDEFTTLVGSVFPGATLLPQRSLALSAVGVSPGLGRDDRLDDADYLLAVAGPDAGAAVCPAIESVRLARVEGELQGTLDHYIELVGRVDEDRLNLRRRLAEQSDALAAVDADRGNLRAALELHEERLREVELDRANLGAEIERVEGIQSAVEVDRDNLRDELQRVEQLGDGLTADRNNLRAELERLNEEHDGLAADRDNLRVAMNRHTAELEGIEADRNNLRAELGRQLELFEGVDTDRRNLRELAEEHGRQLAAAEERVTELEAAYRHLHDDLESIVNSRSWRLLKRLGIVKR
jgi:SAM-dependent methyltransferase